MKYSLILALCLAMLLPACAPKPTVVPAVPPTPVPLPPTVVPAASPTPVPLPTQVIGLVTQAKEIVGIWQGGYSCGDTSAFFIFRKDGTVTDSCNPDFSHGSSGIYWFENQHFLTTADFCGTTAGQYEAQIVQGQGQSKSLVFTLLEDNCEGRAIGMERGFIWVAALP